MPAKVPEYRAGRSHEEFCTTIAREGYALSVRDVMGAMETIVSRRLPVLR